MTENNIALPQPVPQPPLSTRQVWGFWATFGLGLATGVIFVIVQTLMVVAFALERLIKNLDADLQQLTEQLVTNGDLLTAATITSAVLCTGFIFLMIRARSGEPIARYLALKGMSVKAIFVMLAITIGFIAVSSGISYIFNRPVDSDYISKAFGSASLPALFWLSLVLFAPIFEEVFFRGFLFIGFSQSRLGPAGAIVLTSIIFALLHIQYNFFEMALIFFLGIVLGIVRHRTGSLFSSLIIHGFNNLVAMVLVSAM